jgi:hypothetical protein
MSELPLRRSGNTDSLRTISFALENEPICRAGARPVRASRSNPVCDFFAKAPLNAGFSFERESRMGTVTESHGAPLHRPIGALSARGGPPRVQRVEGGRETNAF